MRHFREEYEDHIVAHRCRAGVCQELALSPCENSCPLRMNIPRFLELYQEGRLEDAFESVILDNPLPLLLEGSVSILVITDAAPVVDEVVNMREVHRFWPTQSISPISSSQCWNGFARANWRHRPQGGCAGSGPTGLTAAFYLAMLGHDVTVFEERSEAGGMLRFAIPNTGCRNRCCARNWT